MRENKKAALFICVAVLIFFSGCATAGKTQDGLSLQEAIEKSAEKITAELPGGSRVAIAAFDSASTNLSDYIMEELTGALFDRGIEVADRQNLAYVYKELNFQMSGTVSDESAKSIGKFLAADMTITGSLTDLNGSYSYRISAVNVKTAVRASDTLLDVRADSATRRMVAALANQKTAVSVAKYGVSEDRIPQTAGTFLDRGIMFASRGEYQKAIADFTEAIRLNQDMSAAYELRARALYASISEVSAVGNDFGIIATISYKDVRLSPEQKLTYEQAIADYTQAIRLDPDNTKSYFERGNVYDRQGDYEKAIADFSQAIKLNPNFPTIYTSRGISYSNKGDHDRAITDHTEAIRLDPNSAIIYSNRGLAYKRKGDNNRAIADFTEAVRLDINYAFAYFIRGEIYKDKGDNDKAIADYTQAIQSNPNYAVAYNNRGMVYYKKGDNDRAIADFSQAIQLNPNHVVAYNNRGMVYYEKGDNDRAIADFSQAIRLDPDYTNAYNSRGNAYFNKNDYNRAIADYTQAIRLNPVYADAYYSRGMAYFINNNYERAIVDLGETIRLNPNDTESYYYRGLAFMGINDYEKALGDFMAILRINPNHAKAKQYVDMLRLRQGRNN